MAIIKVGELLQVFTTTENISVVVIAVPVDTNGPSLQKEIFVDSIIDTINYVDIVFDPPGPYFVGDVISVTLNTTELLPTDKRGMRSGAE